MMAFLASNLAKVNQEESEREMLISHYFLIHRKINWFITRIVVSHTMQLKQQRVTLLIIIQLIESYGMQNVRRIRSD